MQEEVCVALGADPHLGARASGVWPGREGSPGPLTPRLLTPQGESSQMGAWVGPSQEGDPGA